MIAGKGYSYLGGATGLTASTSWAGDTATSLGSGVWSAEDVNGDGYADAPVEVTCTRARR